MKKTLLGLVLLFVCSLSFAQERVDRNDLVPFDKSTKALKRLKGYSYDDFRGKWEEIDHGFFANILDKQRFRKLRVRTVNYGGSVYYVLIRYNTKSSSSYCHGHIVGASIEKDNKGYIFTASEFEKIFDLDKTKKRIYPFSEVYSSEDVKSVAIHDYDFYSTSRRCKEYILIRIADDGEMVRFLFPNPVCDEFIPVVERLFETNYLEMSKKQFYKWLEPIMPPGLDKSKFK